MNDYSASYPGAQNEHHGSGNQGPAACRTEPTSFEIANAKARINREFDRLSRSIAAGAGWNAALDATETAFLLELLEEKRSKELNARISLDWIRAWKSNGRARSILLTDSRAARIYGTRNESGQTAVSQPVRYFGFIDQGGFRVFQFGRLPEAEWSPKYRVSVPLTFFSERRMVLQDGPGFSAAILSGRGEPEDCVASLEDLDNFLASRASKTADKSRTRSSTQSRYDAK